MTARALTILTLLLANACGYGPSTELACNDYAQTLCDLRDRCAGGRYFPRTFADRATCVERLQLSCTLASTARNSTRTPLETEACAKRLADPTYSCVDLQADIYPGVCHSPGTRPNGAPCGADSQCQTNVCAGLKTATCGTCAPPPTPGASCVSTECASGQLCVSPSLTCQVPISSGAPCVYAGPTCAYGLYCTGSATKPDGTCESSTATVGESCATAVCEGEYGLSCNSSTRICEVQQLVGDGAACGPLGDGTSPGCLQGGTCYLPNDAGIAPSGKAGTCKAAASDGAACDTMLGPPCVTPARCVLTSTTSTAGTCALPDAAACD